jgi:hypothetical protein
MRRSVVRFALALAALTFAGIGHHGSAQAAGAMCLDGCGLEWCPDWHTGRQMCQEYCGNTNYFCGIAWWCEPDQQYGWSCGT